MLENDPQDQENDDPEVELELEAEGEQEAPEGPRSNTQQEVRYLRQLIDGTVPVSVKVRDGEVFEGVIEYYDDRFIRLTRKDAPNLFIFKKDIKYLHEKPGE